MKLLEPFELRGVRLRNRIVYPPCVTSYKSPEGRVTDLMVESYRYKARNCALCIVEAHAIEPTGNAVPGNAFISDDSFIPGLARLAEAIHGEGAVAGLQLHHGGIICVYSGNVPAWGPSKGQYPWFIPGIEAAVEPCSRERIRELVQSYANAARRVKEAGFDLVEVNGCHGFLVTQFLNGRINQRTDEYGGSLDNRMRFPLEIARAIREAIGPDMLFSYRYNGADWPASPMDQVGSSGDGWTIEDAKIFGQHLEQEGVDVLHISAGNADCPQWSIQPADFPQGCLIDLAAAVKNVVNIPVIGVGHIWHPRHAESILGDGKVDLVAIGRQLIADYHYLDKVRSGRFDEINRCVYCMQGCTSRAALSGTEMTCTVNYLAGREDKLKEEDLTAPAARARKVMVVGGGVAGMSLAVTASRRGHDVVLVERESNLGGQVTLASAAPGRGALGYLNADLKRALAQTTTRVLTSTSASPSLIKQERPDVVVIAVGGRAKVPERFRPLVEQGIIITFDKVLADKVQLGDSVVVYGDGEGAARTADHLARRLGKRVKVITHQAALAEDLVLQDRFPLVARLAARDVEVIAGVLEIKDIAQHSVTLVDKDGTERRVQADNIVLAVDMEPAPVRDEILEWLKQPSMPFVERHVIGDALAVGSLWSACQDGVGLGLQL